MLAVAAAARAPPRAPVVPNPVLDSLDVSGRSERDEAGERRSSARRRHALAQARDKAAARIDDGQASGPASGAC